MGLYNEDESASELGNTIRSQGVANPFQHSPEAMPAGLSVQEHAQLQARTAEQVNPIVSLWHNGFGDWTKKDPTYNPYEKVKDTDYANYPEYFINTDNEDELNAAKTQVDELKQYRELASKAPSTAFWSSMAWGMADPMMALPGVAFTKGASIAGTAAKTAALTAGALGVSEGALQASQPLRTAEDTAITLAAGGIAGAAFGGLAAKLMKPNIAREAEALSIPKQEINAVASVEPPSTEAATTKVPDNNMGSRTTPLVKQFQAENPPDQLLSVKDDMKAFDERMAQSIGKSQEDSESAVKQVLDVTNDRTYAKVAAAMDNIKGDDYRSIDEHLTDMDNASLLKQVEPLPRLEDDEIEKLLEEHLGPTQTGSLADIEKETQGVGAGYVTYDARVKGLPESVLKAVAIPHVINPSIEGLASPSATVRDFTTRLGYMHLPLESKTGEQLAAPLSLESAMQQDLLKSLDFNKAMDDSYLKYLQIDPESRLGSIKSIIKSKFNKDVLSSKEMDELTMDALNAGDRHIIPEVQDRAKYTRGLLDDSFERLKQSGLLGKDEKPLKNYFKVVYDIPEIIRSRMDMERVLTKQFLAKQKAIVKYSKNGKEFETDAILDTRTGNVNWVPAEGEKLLNVQVHSPMDIETARAAASDAVDNILKMGDKSLSLGDIDRLSFTRGTDSGKPRKIVLDEEDYQALKPWMVKDFRKIMQTYLASTSRAVNYKKLLDDLGVDSLQDMRVRIKDEFKERMYKVQNLKEPTKKEYEQMSLLQKLKAPTKENKAKMIAKLNKQAIASEKLFNDLAAIGLGQFKKKTSADAFWRTTNQFNIVRLYGGILLSSLADPTAMFIKNSIPNGVWNGWLSQIRNFAKGTHKLKTQDYRNALTAIQNEIDDLTRHLVNPDMSVYGVGPIERGAQIAANTGMKIQGMTFWNNFWQIASHNLAEHNLISYLEKPWEKLSSREKGYLLEGGIDESMAKRIWSMANPDSPYKYSKVIKGTYIANSHMWRDREAADVFNNAIRTEVHKSPIITEMLDIPRFFQRSEMRKSMALGKGFSFAAVNKLTMSIAARHDKQAFAGLLTIVMAGMVVKAVQDKLAGRVSDYDLKDWILHGIDKSGVLGMLADPLFQARYAKNNIEKWGSRAWVSEPLDYILGPNSSVVSPAYHALVTKLAGKDLDAKTQYQLKALIPYSKLWYARLLAGDKK